MLPNNYNDFTNVITNMYDSQNYYLIKDIEEYIADELMDSRYYEILAEKAPTTFSKDLIIEFSKDEQMHAYNLMKAYYLLTGKNFTIGDLKDPVVPEYKEALRNRVIAETTDYKKYGEKYLKVTNPYLQNMFYEIRTDEAKHAMRISPLLAGF